MRERKGTRHGGGLTLTSSFFRSEAVGVEEEECRDRDHRYTAAPPATNAVASSATCGAIKFNNKVPSTKPHN